MIFNPLELLKNKKARSLVFTLGAFLLSLWLLGSMATAIITVIGLKIKDIRDLTSQGLDKISETAQDPKKTRRQYKKFGYYTIAAAVALGAALGLYALVGWQGYLIGLIILASLAFLLKGAPKLWNYTKEKETKLYKLLPGIEGDHHFLTKALRNLTGEAVNIITASLANIVNLVRGAFLFIGKVTKLNQITLLHRFGLYETTKQVRWFQSRRWQAALHDFKTELQDRKRNVPKHLWNFIKLYSRGPWIEVETEEEFEKDKTRKKLYPAGRSTLRATQVIRDFMQHMKQDLKDNPEKSVFYLVTLGTMWAAPAVLIPPLIYGLAAVMDKLFSDPGAGDLMERLKDAFDEDKLFENNKKHIAEKPDEKGLYRLKDHEAVISTHVEDDLQNEILPILKDALLQTIEDVEFLKTFKDEILLIFESFSHVFEDFKGGTSYIEKKLRGLAQRNEFRNTSVEGSEPKP